MLKTLRLLATALIAALALPAAIASADVPQGADWKEFYIDTPGQPRLHVDVFRPKGMPDSVKTPVILSAGPYFGHGGQSTPDPPTGANRPSNRFDDMIDGGKVFQRGYTVVYADLRGFGGSQGCNDFGGTGEQTDVKRAVEWAASQPWSTGKVGMWGKSYDAWTQVMALDEKPKGLAAAIIQAPIIDGYRTLYQNGVHYDAGWYGTPGLYQGIDAIPPAPADNNDYKLAWAQGFKPDCYAQNIAAQNSTLDRNTAFWQQRELPNARGSDVAVLWSHGFMDANTKPDNFMSVWETLRGPKHAWFGQWAHDRGNEKEKVGRDGFLDESMRWLDKYVKGDPSADVDVDPAVTVQEGDGKFRPENAWPPSDARAFTMPLKAGSVQDAPNNDAEGETSGTYGNGIYSVSQPFPHDAHLAGVPRAKLDIGSAPSSRGHVYTLLYDVDPKGAGQLITRGAHMVNKAGVVDVELYPEDWTIQKGHRLLLLTAGADLDWWNPPHSGGTIQVKGGTLTLPFLQYQRVAYLEGKEALAMEGRKNLQFDLDELADGKVNAQIPPAMTAFPPGLEPRGGRQITREQAEAMLGSAAQRRAAAEAAARRGLQITLRYTRFRGRRFLVALVTGAERYRKVRIDLRRGTRTIRRATRRVRRGGTTRASFRMRGTIRNLRFTAVARNTGGKKRVMAQSLAVRVR